MPLLPLRRRPARGRAAPAPEALTNVYVCHEADAEARVELLDAGLRARGVSLARAPAGATPAAREGMIDAADHFLFVVTPGALASPRCRDELLRARDTGKRLLFVADAAEPPPLELPGLTSDNRVGVSPDAIAERVNPSLRFTAFLSYAREDAAFADALAAALRRGGRKVWLDRTSIRDAQPWRAAIEAGVAACENFVFIVSPDSVASVECGRELAHADAQGKRIVPVLHRGVDLPAMPEPLPSLNVVPFTRERPFQEAVRALLDTLDEDPRHVETHTWLLARALEWHGSGRDRSWLLEGSELRGAERWLAAADGAGEPARERRPLPTALQRALVAESRAHRARRRRLRAVAGVAAAALLVLAGLALARGARDRREGRARTLAAVVRAGEAPIPPEIALGVGLEALRLHDSPETRAALFSNLARVPRLLAVLPAPSGLPTALAYTRDGTLLVGTDSGTVAAWPRGRSARTRRGTGRDAAVLAMAVSPDGRLFAIGTWQGEIQLVETETFRMVARWPGEEGVRAMAFDSAGARLAVGSNDGLLRVFDTRTRVEVARSSFPRTPGRVAFAGTGIVALDDGGTLYRWEIATGASPRSTGRVEANVFGTALSDDGARLAVATGDSVWVLATDDGRRLLAVRGPGGGGFGERPIAFDPLGRTLALGDSAGTIRRLDLRTGAYLPDVLRGHDERGVYELAFSRDGRTLATTGLDGRVLVWDATGDGALGRPLPPPADGSGAYRVAIDDAGTVWMAQAATWTGPVRVAEQRPGRATSFQALGGLAPVHDLRPRRGGGFVAVGTPRTPEGRSVAALWDGARVLRVPVIARGDTATQVTAAAVSPGGARVAFALSSGETVVWDPGAGRRVTTLVAGVPQRDVRVLAFSGDGRRLAAAQARDVVVWSLETLRPLHRAEDASFPDIESVALDSAGRLLAFGGDEHVHVRDLGARGHPTRRLTGPRWGTTELAFSPDGRLLAGAGTEGGAQVYLWDVASGERLAELWRDESPEPVGVAFDPRGDRLVTGGRFPMVWEASPAAWRRRACAIVGAQPLPEEWRGLVGHDRSPCRTER